MGRAVTREEVLEIVEDVDDALDGYQTMARCIRGKERTLQRLKEKLASILKRLGVDDDSDSID